MDGTYYVQQKENQVEEVDLFKEAVNVQPSQHQFKVVSVIGSAFRAGGLHV